MGCGSCYYNKPVSAMPIRRFRKSMTTQKIVPLTSFSDTYAFGDKLLSSPYVEIRKCIHKTALVERTLKIVKHVNEDISQSDLHDQLLKLSQLDHPNIVKIYDLLYDSHRLILVLENWDGSLLLDLLTESKELLENQIVNIAEQLLSALSLAHNTQIIHGDIHLGNIFLTKKGKSFFVKLIGFGIYGRTNYKHLDYIAPEMHSGHECEKSDVWSVGIIIYILFTGSTPYHGANIKEKILTTPLNLNLLRNLGASDPSIDLIRSMLTISVHDRISVKDALKHPWIQLYKTNNLPKRVRLGVENLSRYKKSISYKEAIESFIASQIVRNEEEQDMLETFKSLDVNGDGKLGRSELQHYFLNKMSPTEAEEAIESIMRHSDTDQSGYLEYTEFIKAGTKRDKLMCKKHLKSVFSMLDADSNGTLSVDELLELGAGSEIIEDLVRKADKNKDGEIDMMEFFSILIKI